MYLIYFILKNLFILISWRSALSDQFGLFCWDPVARWDAPHWKREEINPENIIWLDSYGQTVKCKEKHETNMKRQNK